MVNQNKGWKQFDENVTDYWELPIENYIVKLRKDEGLDDNCDIKNTLPSHLGSFILSISKRNMNNFIREIRGFFNSSIHCGDTGSLYIEKKYWYKLDKANLFREDLWQAKKDLKSGGTFSGIFVAPKKIASL